MKNTAAKLVSAIFATVLAGSPLIAAPETEEKAEKEKPADTCLLGPSASVPSGGHWYYRYDKRQQAQLLVPRRCQGEICPEAGCREAGR